MDYEQHNKKSKEIWAAYEAGQPIRVPVTIYADARNWLAEKSQNKQGIKLRQYLTDPQVMLETQVRTQEWIRLMILSDDGMGYPDSWHLRVDCQNYLEMAWFGCEISSTDEPHSYPFLNNDNKNMLFDKGLFDPWSGIHRFVKQTYEYFLEQKSYYHYQGIPIGTVLLPYNMTGTDGPFTIACGIRGTESFLLDLIDDPTYAKTLLKYVTENIINRIKAVRTYLGEPRISDIFGFADDAITLLSPELYVHFVLPCHKRIFDELSLQNGFRSMHLCGDAQRFFQIIQNELHVMQFDTGFPVDFNKLYQELNPGTRILGGPPISLLLNGTTKEIDESVRRILNSGVMSLSEAFILREANALAPGTPLRHVNQIYMSAEKYGYYRDIQNASH